MQAIGSRKEKKVVDVYVGWIARSSQAARVEYLARGPPRRTATALRHKPYSDYHRQKAEKETVSSSYSTKQSSLFK